MKKLLLSFTASALMALQLSAQAPNLVFNNTYNTPASGVDYGTSLLDLGNNEIALAGYFSVSNGILAPKPMKILGESNGYFLTKMNEIGAKIWSKNYSGEITQMVKDNGGNIYVVGSFIGTAATINSIPHGNQGNNSLSQSNIFLAKVSPTGSLVWSKVIGGTSNDYGNSIAIDGAGDIYLGGRTEGSYIMDFEVGNAAATQTFVALNSFVVKYNSSGNFGWIKTFPINIGGADAVCVDQNNIYFSSTFAGSNVNFNSQGTYTISSNVNSTDIALIKMRKNGTFVSAKAIGGTSASDYPRSIQSQNGKIILGGSVSNGTVVSVNMNGNGVVPTLTVSSNGKDGFIAMYDTTSLDCLWAKTIGGTTANDEVRRVNFDYANNILVSGKFAGTATNFNIGGTNVLANGSGIGSYYYASYAIANGNCNWVYADPLTPAGEGRDIFTDTEDKIWSTGMVNTSSFANDVYLNKHKCASTYTMNLIQTNGTKSYTLNPFGGNTFAHGACLTQTTQFNAVVTPSTNLKITYYDMNNNVVQGSALTMPITSTSVAPYGYKIMIKDSVTKCEQVYSYQFSQVNSQTPALTLTPNNSTICVGTALTLSANVNYSGITYTWEPGSITTPANTRTLSVSPTTSTTYTTSTYDGVFCAWTATTNVTVDLCTNIKKTESQENVLVYPNPATDVIYIETEDYHNVSIAIYGITGQLIKTQNLSEQKNKISLTDLDSGIYFVTIKSSNNTNTYKIIKQ